MGASGSKLQHAGPHYSLYVVHPYVRRVFYAEATLKFYCENTALLRIKGALLDLELRKSGAVVLCYYDEDRNGTVVLW